MAQTGSFIPKQAKPVASRTRTVRKVYLFSYISYVVFFGTLLVVAALFVYEVQINKNLNNQKSALIAERESFSQSDIERVREFEARLLTANMLFSQHAAVSVLLEGFEKTVLENVQFNNFSFLREPDGTYVASAEGVTSDFDSLLFQRQVLKEDDLFSQSEISNIGFSSTEDEDSASSESRISFTLKKVVTPAEISYMNIAAAQANAPESTDDSLSASLADDTVLFDQVNEDVVEFAEDFSDTAQDTGFFEDGFAETPDANVNDQMDQFNQNQQ